MTPLKPILQNRKALSDDLMLPQKVVCYLEQAKKGQRFREVAMLETQTGLRLQTLPQEMLIDKEVLESLQ